MKNGNGICAAVLSARPGKMGLPDPRQYEQGKVACRVEGEHAQRPGRNWLLKTSRWKWATAKARSELDARNPQLKVGSKLKVNAVVKLGRLKPDDISVELYHGPLDCPRQYHRRGRNQNGLQKIHRHGQRASVQRIDPLLRFGTQRHSGANCAETQGYGGSSRAWTGFVGITYRTGERVTIAETKS